MGLAKLLAATAVVLALSASSASAMTLASGRTHAGASAKAEVTITASDGKTLACGVVVPAGPPPAGGWPGIIMFHGLGQSHVDMEGIAAAAFAPFGFAALACDARGTGNSEGQWGLDGATEAQDAQDLYNWFAGNSTYNISATQIGAFGLSLGGGAVWDAAVAGVPFKAIVPTITWTSLGAALNPNNVVKTGLVGILASVVPFDNWTPELQASGGALLQGTISDAAKATEAARSWRSALHNLKVPTLLMQGRHDFLFDIDQALAAYKDLGGPKALYIGDLGHPPAPNPVDEQSYYLGAAIGWFSRYLTGSGTASSGIEIAHDPWDGSTTNYKGLPKTRTTSVTLPGTTPLAATASATRSAKLTGGPLETFGDGSITVRYSGASNWTHLVATVTVKGSATPVTEGAAAISAASGVATIHLMDECVLLPRGKKIVVTLGAISNDNNYGVGVPTYATPEPNGATIKIGRVTLKLSLLKKTISH